MGEGRIKTARKMASRQTDGGATTGYEAELWAMADALRGSMDAAEYKHKERNSVMKYTVVIERTPNNFAAYVPDLPGCVTTASTRGELLEEIREAIEFHIEGMREDGEPIPEPQATSDVVEVSAAAG